MMRDKPSNGLPVPVVMVGSSPRFVRAMQVFSTLLPKMFRNLDRLKLQGCYQGLDKIRIVEATEKGADTHYYDRVSDVISIYPFASSAFARLDKVLYEALGERYWYKEVSTEGKVRWTKKLVYPKKSVIDRLQTSFSRGGKTSFSQFVDEFKTADEKLIAIHLCNALIRNSARAVNSKTIVLSNHPATATFAKAKAPYSLIPLLSAYCGGRNPIESYEHAFASYCSERGKIRITEPSVADALVSLFQSVSFDRR